MPTQPPRSADRPEGDRIAKLLARAGVASRREIERMIAEGRVALNGTVLDTPATILASLKGVTVDGKPVGKAQDTLVRHGATLDQPEPQCIAVVALVRDQVLRGWHGIDPEHGDLGIVRVSRCQEQDVGTALLVADSVELGVAAAFGLG